MTDETATPNEEPKADTCPECGQDLSDRDPEGHAVGHWGETTVDPARGKDAAERQRKLRDLAAGRRDASKGGGR
jgi:hypothetical protein